MARKSKKDEVVEVVDLIPAANEKMKASDTERKTSQEIVDGLKRQKVESWDSKVTFNIEGDDVPIAKMEPKVFFDNVKTMKHETTSEVMKIFYENALKKLNRYRITRQIDAAKKILFYMKVMEKEIDLIDRGVNTFIYVQDILNYIDHVDNKSICITTIDRYEREIPDDIIDKMEKLDGIFDQYYILFVDYTGKQRQKVEKERRTADPILFGVFQNGDATYLCDRWYYIGDWIDEQCDLTLSQILTDIKTMKGDVNESEFTHEIRTPMDVAAFEEELKHYKKDANGNYVYENGDAK